jgi:hypothetical protein
MELHRITLLRNGIECSCGHETLLRYVPDEAVIDSIAIHHWIEVGHMPVTGREYQPLNVTIK